MCSHFAKDWNHITQDEWNDQAWSKHEIKTFSYLKIKYKNIKSLLKLADGTTQDTQTPWDPFKNIQEKQALW